MKLGMVVNPLGDMEIHKDTSFAILLAAQQQGHEAYYIPPENLWLQDGITWGRMQRVTVEDNAEHWFDLGKELEQPLVELDCLLMRKDPPFDMDYINLTYLLEQAEAGGLKVVNKPRSLRDANEKLFTAWFPQCCPKTLVASDPSVIHEFLKDEGHTIIKPLDGMGGSSVFSLKAEDPNAPVIIEKMTHRARRLVMVQRYIPEITQGDKRILMIDGDPVPYALARVPKQGDFRGNLAAGATGEGRELTEHDRWICEQVGPTLRKRGLMFVGLDVIGDYLTEINVTSPTCVRELDAQFGLDIAGDLLNKIQASFRE